jgi:meso-butanediol dehydrogenase/(S,S)-butanediol dehydrogenase/diacetyl reductase
MPGVAIVTGSSRGIGEGIVKRLASDGFRVVVSDILANQAGIERVVSEINEKGQHAIGLFVDVTSKESIENLVNQTVEKLGDLSVMVANAGTIDMAPLLEISTETWDRVYSVNTRGVMLSYQIAAKQMIKQGHGGKLIAACSISGFRPSGKCPSYCSSKWAVRGLTQSAALELGEYGITVNAYCPGSVKTDMSSVFASRLAKERGIENVEQAYKTSSHRKTALNRELFPEDIAKLVSFLAGPDSDNMTGQTIIYDGGMVFS